MSIYMILNMYKFCFVSNAISKFFYFLPIQWKLGSVLISIFNNVNIYDI
jgi:hypothetical protein